MLLPSQNQLLSAFAFSAFIVDSTATPTNRGNQHVEKTLKTRAGLNIVKTTTTDTQTIDWVALDSQGKIAELPPPRTPREGPRPTAELEQAGAELGPAGTVPVSRTNLDYLTNAPKKVLPEIQFSKRQNAGVHWYCQANQTVTNIGGTGTFSMFAPYTQSDADFSLLQTAVTRHDVNIQAGRFPPFPGTQTVEAGWINWKQQVAQPHLFTYYTSNNYVQEGNNQGGWNTDFTGWVQVDPTIHPGSVFTPLSIDGGAQNDLKIEYNLHKGNWWLAVEDKWIGYYPGSLFSTPSSDPASSTLAGGSDTIYFYGEVTNNEETLTTTDMGSGEFANKGYGKAGYIFNIAYTNPQNVSKPFNGPWRDSDTSRYTHESHFLSGTKRGSYAFIGGPGAGGKIGG
ncbi:carboxyl-terminal proteinase [Glarea lozoyensis ATCC 20868]|uniref:Carboxyl-terminal proteinase n=1 Tax=Glarea lozoyensis (strain ATCC 20868 / MF5171) TaxID=1116229 RepID=S3DH10_GLAL2|nr:carboxyl-terminal proteinase [Glarea lozoyensis ATCC 20868]EPE36429.1 carboxyl-terminal proteinase [Glarea lozoyensis ATCC 20868]